MHDRDQLLVTIATVNNNKHSPAPIKPLHRAKRNTKHPKKCRCLSRLKDTRAQGTTLYPTLILSQPQLRLRLRPSPHLHLHPGLLCLHPFPSPHPVRLFVYFSNYKFNLSPYLPHTLILPPTHFQLLQSQMPILISHLLPIHPPPLLRPIQLP